MRIASLIVLLMKVEKRNYVLTVSLHNFNNFIFIFVIIRLIKFTTHFLHYNSISIMNFLMKFDLMN